MRGEWRRPSGKGRPRRRRGSVGSMRAAADHIDTAFAQQVRAFGADLDHRARDRFPAILDRALESVGLPRSALTEREAALADALLAELLEVTGEVVGLAMRQGADLLIDSLSKARVGFDDAR